MSAILIRIHPENPEERKIDQIVDALKQGAVIIYPTDTVYGIGCDIFNAKAVAQIARIKGIKPEKANFAMICHDLSHISNYARPIPNNVFKIMKKALPGPFTFLLEASGNLPKTLSVSRKQIGIRIPDHKIPLSIVHKLDNPLLTSSLKDEDEVLEYTTDPELIFERYKNLVDIVIDGGYGNNIPSTIVDCSTEPPLIIRQGLGDFTPFL